MVVLVLMMMRWLRWEFEGRWGCGGAAGWERVAWWAGLEQVA